MKKRYFFLLFCLLGIGLALGYRYGVQAGVLPYTREDFFWAEKGKQEIEEVCHICGEKVEGIDHGHEITPSLMTSARPSEGETAGTDLVESEPTIPSKEVPASVDLPSVPSSESKELTTSCSSRPPTTKASTTKATTVSTISKTQTTKTSAPTKKATTTAQAKGSYYENYEAEVVRLVNRERAKEGLAPLKMDASLRASARLRAKEIVNCWGHTRPNGSRFCTAIKLSYSKAGENIAAGQATADKVVQSWLDSPSHRANIMNPQFKLIGVGCYYNTETPYKIYWSQIFLAP